MSNEHSFKAILDAANAPRGDVNRREVAEYLNSSSRMPGPAPGEHKVEDVLSEPTRKDVRGKTKYCTTTKFSLTASPDKIVTFEPDKAALWPGALLQGDTLINVGSFRELPIKKRAPLNVTVDLFVTPSTKPVPNPSFASVTEAISDLISPLQGRDFGSSMSFAMKDAYSSAQAMLSLGFSAKYGGASIAAKHTATTSLERSVTTASYIQKCFTASVDNPLTPVDLFSPDFSLADLEEQERLGRISKADAPILLSSVTYGRILYVTISSTKEVSELKEAVSMSAHNTTGDLEKGSKNILSASEFTVSGIGLEESNAQALITSGKIQDFFSKPMDIRSAKPISYIFYNLRDLSIAGLTDAATYDITVCRNEVVSPKVQKASAEVETNLLNHRNFVVAAAGNKNDFPSRNLRTGQYRLFHSEVIAQMDWISVSALSDTDSKNWVRDWIPSIVDEIEKNSRVFKNGYDNDPEGRPIYSEGLRQSAEQKAKATDIVSGAGIVGGLLRGSGGGLINYLRELEIMMDPRHHP